MMPSLTLKVKPQITPDSNIIMDVQVNKDARGVQTTAGPAIDTRNVKTSVLVENGGTVVIGGIYTRNSGLAFKKVPYLADIPILGWLFKSRQENDERTELLIFITPRIIRG